MGGNIGSEYLFNSAKKIVNRFNYGENEFELPYRFSKIQSFDLIARMFAVRAIVLGQVLEPRS
jgi:hypothetical protein